MILEALFLEECKMGAKITFARDDKAGFWEERGYHNNADPVDGGAI